MDPGVFFTIQRKSMKEDACKDYDRTGQPVVFDLWEKPQTNGFPSSFLHRMSLNIDSHDGDAPSIE